MTEYIDPTELQRTFEDIKQGLDISFGFGKAFRNKIINGNFDVWNNGTSFTSDGEVADNWYLTEGASEAVTVSRQAFAAGQTDVPNNPQYYLRFARTTTGIGPSRLSVRIPDVNFLSAQTVSVSYWAWADQATNINVRTNQYFGSGGSDDVATDNIAQAITTTKTRYTHQIALATLTGKTLGTGDYTELIFELPVDAGNVQLDLAQVQLEPGSIVTPFEARSAAVEIALTSGVTVDAQALNNNDSTEYTISSGAITPEVPSFTVDTESDAAIDNLDTINTTNFQDGDIIFISSANSSRDIVLRHGEGNIRTPTGDNITLDNTDSAIALRLNVSNWIVWTVAAPGAPTITDLTLRTNIAEAWFDLLTNNNLAKTEFADGFADVFEDETGVDTGTSTNETYESASEFYSPTLTGGGEDGTWSDSAAASRNFGTATANNIAGIGWTAGTTGPLASVKIEVDTVTGSGVFKVGVYADSGGSPGTQVGSYSDDLSITTTGTKTFSWTSGAPSLTAGSSYWIAFETVSGSTNIIIDTTVASVNYTSDRAATVAGLSSASLPSGEEWRVQINYAATTASNMTLVSNAVTADAEPDTIDVVVQHEPVDSVTLNTDCTIEVSIDGGSTWATGTLAQAGTDGSVNVLTASEIDVSGQTGTSIKYRFSTDNEKEQRLHAISITWS